MRYIIVSNPNQFMRKSLIVSIALLVVGLIAGIWITRYFYQKKQKEIIESQSTVMLEKVRKC